MAKKKVPTNKGYDPYNKPAAAKPKAGKPAYTKASPNNPRNNAGPKIKASSRGPTSLKASQTARQAGKVDNVSKAMTREFQRATPKNTFSTKAAVRGTQAGEGMVRKNVQKTAEVGLKRMTSPTNPKVSKGVNAYAKYNQRMTQLPKGVSPTATKAVARGAGRVLGAAGRIAGAAGAVFTAAQAGYALGSAVNKKYNISGKIVDSISPKYDPNAKTGSGRSRTLTTTGSYDSPALKVKSMYNNKNKRSKR